ncbi:glycogen debranching enzyme GlgX [Psychromonas sp. psych-6C06]|uniref:glycogen debranching protein GlgX n=1 Tax=Psychromonas sp. psych-6C06 TaxID=2058089 RepID=UPI000C33BDAC|nr:glycogen debranching protein GlgX [Psychromonas sp. psych-6C06]PKF60479.1 glycogen debranching enzyme GlgX [Psychromonas sp. psych-6C06]
MYKVSQGVPDKLGVTFSKNGANFCVYARLAESVELLFFDHKDSADASKIFKLSDITNRTAYYWHIFIEGVTAGQLYAFRVNGPYRPHEGLSFQPDKVLLDPYGLLVERGESFCREAAIKEGSNVDKCLKSVVVDIDDYDWEDDQHPRHPFATSVIYEMHVGGFTRHPSSGVSEDKRGTYAGLVEKIPYLKELGITAVELMPVHQFDPSEHHAGLVNYWGYSPLSLFSTHREYSSDQSVLGPINEFRDMVKALHAADIEVILDVVYNHTAEGDENGPTLSFRGFDSSVYYIMSEDRKHYMNFSGCGNTLNGTHSVVRRMIIDSLHFWVEKMHVDGFRFDLASILSRDELGRPMLSPPTLWSIDTDPILSPVKLIAEAWDAGGLYQVGSLAGQRWREWNGHFRDDVRRFVRGDPGLVGKFVSRLIGSPDVYGEHNLEPEKSVNFITCHDGFTLHDLVSYNDKHNLANGEQNRDGCSDNFSWNHGVEGPTGDKKINQLRLQQIKNLLAINLISLGTPMILMGDEIARSQLGNNNGYCQDNPDFWFNWDNVKKNKELFRFTKALIEHRTTLEAVHLSDARRDSLHDIIAQSGIRWHGIKVNQPDWGEHSHAIAMESKQPASDHVTYVVFNAYWEDLTFELPAAPSGKWQRVVDTALKGGEDIYVEGDKKYFACKEYLVAARSLVILIG